MSPVRMRWGGLPSKQIQPLPAITLSIWPCSCWCQWVRPPGAKNTLLMVTLSVVGMMGSPHTVPVQVAEPVRDSEGTPAWRA